MVYHGFILIPVLETGITMMDLGCGTGGYVLGLAQRFPKSNFTGVEYSDRAFEIANKRKQDEGLSNMVFQFGDAHNLPETWTDKFDMVFIYDVLHDLPDPLKALSEVYRVLKPSGYLGLVEMNFHSNPVDNVGNMTTAMYYGASSFVCLPCSMSAEPRVGYGACWGVENIEKALRDSKFSILDKVKPHIVTEIGISVMDLGCGTGNNVFGLAQRFPKSNFTGVEYSHRALEIANKRKQDEGLSNIDFQFGDAHNLPATWTDMFDMVFMYDVLHDLPDPLKALSEVYRVLKPSGYLGLVEMNFHSNPVDNVGNMTAAMYYGASSFVCLPCSMSAEPRVGYGACWGVENIEKALADSKFSTLDKSNPNIVTESKVFYFCSKV